MQEENAQEAARQDRIRVLDAEKAKEIDNNVWHTTHRMKRSTPPIRKQCILQIRAVVLRVAYRFRQIRLIPLWTLMTPLKLKLRVPAGASVEAS